METSMLNLPVFRPTNGQRIWVANELRTSRWVQLLWGASSSAQRRDPDFMMLLARSAWVNRGEAAGEPERLLRNRFLAAWLVIKEPVDDDDLQATLARKLRLLPSEARWLVSTSSGITHYYKA